MQSLSFTDFKFDCVLGHVLERKTLYIKGYFGDKLAVVILEKLTHVESQLPTSLSSLKLLEEGLTLNDKYIKGNAISDHIPMNQLYVQIICPASEKDVEKYTIKQQIMISETPELYHTVVKPVIDKHCPARALDWVYNILEGRSEVDNVLFHDPDPEIGFVLLPDFKWDNRSNIDNLYCLAICHKRDITCLRELNQTHVPLLTNILNKGCAAIEEQFGLKKDQLRIFIHYQPSFYHLHVHFTNIAYTSPGTQVEKAHLLEDVIFNISLLPDFYQRKTLYYKVRVDHDIAVAVHQQN